jgi:hypothetical protein
MNKEEKSQILKDAENLTKELTGISKKLKSREATEEGRKKGKHYSKVVNQKMETLLKAFRVENL